MCFASKWYLAFLLCYSLATAHAQCVSTITATAATADFDDLGAWVKHRKTGLIWQRCQLGQTWDAVNRACSVNPNSQSNFTWPQAVVAATGNRDGGYADWRLPNKIEVMTLVERSCVLPAVNTTIFPSLQGYVWTATPALFADGYAWRQDFDRGEVITGDMTNTHAVLLVRDPNP